ncbi:MAG: hypothetical protein WCT53_04040, partial [Candidatus Gracilibacteria bacterium]
SFKISPKFMQAGDDKKVAKHLEDCKKFYETHYVKIETLAGTTQLPTSSEQEEDVADDEA